jgi:hypothetical protein
MHIFRGWFQKSKWRLPEECTTEEKCSAVCFFLWYADEGEDMLNRIVTGDESWVHHYQPKSMSASMQWKHPSSPSTKKFKVTSMLTAGKLCLPCFWILKE